MLRLVKPFKAPRLRRASIRRYRSSTSYSTANERRHDPLNILFCGADEFSIYSLRALRELRAKQPEKIARIDVVCRRDKYVGRGLKKVQEVPIKSVANDLRLDLHQIDTFKNWHPPEPTDLIVAVSFGLLVPARILNGAKYGGLNVHPSMLPDLRGPAPITHALLKRRAHIGVTLQTMHPTRFDHGVILSQTPPPGIPIPESSTPDDLIRALGPLSADMLCQGIENSLFIDPKDVGNRLHDPEQLDHAPKITPQDREIDWKTWKADEIVLQDRVLGRLWDTKSYMRCFGSLHPKRIAFDGPWKVVFPETASVRRYGSDSPGVLMLVHHQDSKKASLAFKTCDHRIIVPTAVTIDGQKKGTGMEAFVNHLIR